MPTYTFDFNLSAWIRNLDIEADSEEEAREKLNAMRIGDIDSNLLFICFIELYAKLY